MADQAIPTMSTLEVKEEIKVTDVFDFQGYPHILPSDESDYSDFEEEDKVKHPELFMTDEEIDDVFNNDMTDSERKLFLEYKNYHMVDYMKRGHITCMSRFIRSIMKTCIPGIPSETKAEQEALRIKLLQKARTKEELREKGVIPEKKPAKRPRVEFLGPPMVEEKQADGTIIIKMMPGMDPFEGLVHDEDEVIDMTGAETASEEDPDEESADDLSVVTIDSLANIDKEKVKETWKKMEEAKIMEAQAYNQLASMVEDMSPAVIQETISKTPKPGTNIPTCVEELFEELGDSSKFRKVVACGYMMYETYLKSKKKDYKPATVRSVARRFNVDVKGLMELRRGEAYEREKKKAERMIKKEEEMKQEVPPEPEPSEGKEYITSSSSLQTGGEVRHPFDCDTFEASQVATDLEEKPQREEEPSETSYSQPSHQVGGEKRKREPEDE